MAEKKAAKTAAAPAPRLKALYKEQYAKELQAELGLANINQVPELEKIVVSVGIGKNKDDKRHYEVVKNTLEKITGQHPVDRMAKKSIATFKIRAGMNRVGISVTLRGARMYEFLDRLVNIALPRVRDFKGIENKLDGRGNYTLGITEQIIFPEINIDNINRMLGMNITFVTTAKTDEEGFALLKEFGLPFKKN
jgi:large subunit ribosomal protein L5